jgi:hypothetical protein
MLINHNGQLTCQSVNIVPNESVVVIVVALSSGIDPESKRNSTVPTN